ncbi:MAG: hypothetical protein ACYC2H_02980 [Thermoplasmatota archaeon]
MPSAPKTKPKRCFVVGPIGEEGTAIRKRADQVVKHVIDPVLTERGYDRPLRADQIGKPGLISNQIIAELLQADLVVADLAGHNANVFYELGVRHAFRRHVVMLYESKVPIPFDVAGMRSISLDMTDPDSIEQARIELAKHVEAIAEGVPAESPVSVAATVQNLAISGNQSDRLLSELSKQIEDLRTEVRSTSNAPITRPESLWEFASSRLDKDPKTFVSFGDWLKRAVVLCEVCQTEIPDHQVFLRHARRCVEHIGTARGT